MANPSRQRHRRGHYLNLRRLEHWQRLWTEAPDRMEAVRKIATEAAATARRGRTENLKDIVSQWPAVLTPTDFRKRIAALASLVQRPKGKRPYQPDSLRRRLTTAGFVSFDPAMGTYCNRLSVASPQ